MNKLLVILLVLISVAAWGQGVGQGFTPNVSSGGTAIADSTRLFQDTILLHYLDGNIVRRDTVRVAMGAGPTGPAGPTYYYHVSELTWPVALATAAAHSGEAHILVDENVSISLATTIPEDVTLTFRTGAIMSVTASLTLNGYIEANPETQIFNVSGAGAISGATKTETWYAEWFGAARDGATDDLAAIRAAAAVLRIRGGGTLELLAGDYYCPGFVSVFSNTTVRGAGKYLTTLECSSTIAGQEYLEIDIPTYNGGAGLSFKRGAMFVIGAETGTTANSATHVVYDVENVTIEDLGIIMHDQTMGFPFYSASRTTTIPVLHTKRSYEDRSAKNITVQRVYVKEPQVGIALGIVNLGQGDPDVEVAFTQSEDLKIIDCTVENVSNKALEVYATKGVVIQGNHIENAQAGIQLFGHSSDATISNNTGNCQEAFVNITNHVSNVIVRENIAERIATSGITTSTYNQFRTAFCLFNLQYSGNYAPNEWINMSVENILITNNAFTDTSSPYKNAVGVSPSHDYTPSGFTWTVRDIIVANNVFNANQYISALGSFDNDPIMQNWTFLGNIYSGSILSDNANQPPKENFVMNGGSVLSASTLSFEGEIVFNGVHFAAGLNVTSGAQNVTVANATVRTGATITVAGTGNTVTNTVTTY